MECFRCSPKPGKWGDGDPEGTSTASNHLRTELQPPSSHLEGTTSRPTKGKACIGMKIWGKNGRAVVPKLIGPRGNSNPEKSTGDRKISAPGPQICYQNEQTKHVFGQLLLISPLSGPCPIFLSSCLMFQYAVWGIRIVISISIGLGTKIWVGERIGMAEA